MVPLLHFQLAQQQLQLPSEQLSLLNRIGKFMEFTKLQALLQQEEMLGSGVGELPQQQPHMVLYQSLALSSHWHQQQFLNQLLLELKELL